MESEETRDPGTSETPTGVPPANDEPAQNVEDDQVAGIDDQPQGDDNAEAGSEAGGASDTDEGASDTPKTSETGGV